MGQRPKHTSREKALKIEAMHLDPTGPKKFTRSAKLIADVVGVSERSVRDWRKEPGYREEALRRFNRRPWDERNAPPSPSRGDPPEGTVEDGMVFANGAWQEIKTKKAADGLDRYLSRSTALKRKQAAYASHKAKRGDGS